MPVTVVTTAAGTVTVAVTTATAAVAAGLGGHPDRLQTASTR